jgi:O-antigen polymerase
LRIQLQQRFFDKIIPLIIPLPYILAGSIASIALYQYFFLNPLGSGLVMSANMGNSGAVASYMAMLFPLMLIYVNASKKSIFQYVYRIVIALTLIALFFTQARAAWIAVAVSSLFILFFKNATKIKETVKQYKKIKNIFLFVFMCLFISSGYLLFSLKKDSANGRLFIWKRTLEVFADSPITGVGFQQFGSVYPLYQSKYLQQNPQDSAKLLANDINHAFNEYFHIAAELGGIGLILFLMIFVCLGIPFFRKKEQLDNLELASYAGVLSFLILSFFTYPFKIFSIQFLLIGFIAIIVSKFSGKVFFSIVKKGITAVLSFSCLILVFVSISELNRFKKEASWKEVYEQRSKLSWKTRARVYEKLYPIQQDNWDFLSIYGIELTVNKDYRKAIEVLELATKYMKTSDLYTHLGISYEETGAYEKARIAYETGIYMVPHKFFPKYRLVFLYQKMGLNLEAVTLAKNMLSTTAKIKSKVAIGIKYEMKKFLKQYEY